MSKGRRWMSQLKLSAYQPFLCLFVLFKSSTVQVMLAKLMRAIFMSHFINANASLSDTPLQTHTEIMCNQLSVHLKTIKLVHKINHRNEVPLCISQSNFLRDLVTFLATEYHQPKIPKNSTVFQCTGISLSSGTHFQYPLIYSLSPPQFTQAFTFIKCRKCLPFLKQFLLTICKQYPSEEIKQVLVCFFK